NLALFYLADAVKTVVMGSLVVALFFPWGLSWIFKLSGAVGAIVDVIFFFLKVLIIITISVTFVRVAAARLKIDQVAYTYFIPITVLAFCGLVLIVIDELLVRVI
ncbi:MAG: NADH-quinone oxidoreductase subunit H, partial [Candidatus Thermoplasmatota archaeon]